MKEINERDQCKQLQKLSKQETIRLREQHIGASVTLFFKKAPIKIVKGSGQYMLDEQGNSYLDCINNVAHVGHCHPHVVEAGAQQMSLLSTNSRYLHDNLVLYAQRLTRLFPPKLSVCYFVNSGSEANDLALRLARAHTGHKDVIALEGAYHGHLTSIVDISPYKFKKINNYQQKKWVHLAPLPCTYRGKYSSDRYPIDKIGRLYADEVQRLIDQAHARNRKIGAFIAESMVSCGGQFPLPEGYLRQVYKHVRAAGGVCIADEVQVGFGRVGDKFWAFELAGDDVCPDIVTLGKPIGNGHPVACVVTTPEIAASFESIGTEYFNTYGGNPVSIAIANAVLDVIEQEKLCQNAKQVGDFMLKEIGRLQEEYEFIGDVRGHGLFLGVEIVKDKRGKQPAPEMAEFIVSAFKQNLVLMSTEGIEGNILKFKPPMCFNMDNAIHWLDVFERILVQASSNQRSAVLLSSLARDQDVVHMSTKNGITKQDSGLGSCCSNSTKDGSISSSSCLSDDSLTSLSSSGGEDNL